MKALSPEQMRIMIAAADGRLRMTLAGRYEIEDEAPPDRRERERLQNRDLLTRPSRGGLMVTDRGQEAMATAPISEDISVPRTAQTTLDDLSGKSEEGTG